MAFSNLSSGDTTTFLSSLRWNAKDAKFESAVRVQGEDGWDTVITNITEPLKSKGFLLDLAGTELGWINFDERPISLNLSHHSFPMPVNGDKDNINTKEGFRFQIYLPKELADGEPVREHMSNARSYLINIQRFHSMWVGEANTPARQSGQELARVVFEPTNYGKVRPAWAPDYTIAEWLERPSDWPIQEFTPPAPQPQPVAAGPNLDFGKTPADTDGLPF